MEFLGETGACWYCSCTEHAYTLDLSLHLLAFSAFKFKLSFGYKVFNIFPMLLFFTSNFMKRFLMVMVNSRDSVA